MNLGFVGVGPHAEKLARVLTELGAQVVCHDRASSAPGPEWAGTRMSWRDMLTAGLDGIVAVATPKVTTEVVREWFRGQRGNQPRLLATKPLLFDGAPDCYVSANLHVDLWRLWSPSWRAFRDDLQSRGAIESVNVVCVGNGPDRGYSGVLDYGPHAMAFVHDLLGAELGAWEGYTQGIDKLKTLYSQAAIGGTKVSLTTGNSANAKEFHVTARVAGVDYYWWELGNEQVYSLEDLPFAQVSSRKQLMNHRDVALRAFCRSFLNGEPNDSFRLSTAGYRVLRGFDV
jgi:hypothetical protein